MYDIKKLKPRKQGRFKQGYINPQTCKKLFPSKRNTPIIYRSSYERRFIEYLESNPKVQYWGSECTPIDYTDSYDNTHHTYFPDYVALIEGVYHLFEIKPYNQCIAPSPLLPKDGYAWKTYIKNLSKWKATQTLCESKGMKFQIITEKTISKL